MLRNKIWHQKRTYDFFSEDELHLHYCKKIYTTEIKPLSRLLHFIQFVYFYRSVCVGANSIEY